MIVPPTLRRFTLPASVLADSAVLLRESGRDGFEAIVVWVGRPLDGERAEILGAMRPRQIARRSELGVSVEVPPDALSELIEALPAETAILARLHTHPGRPYHSDLDDTNMLIAHQGAISIVVPDFAAEPIELSRCSVNILDHEQGWRELGSAEVARRFIVI